MDAAGQRRRPFPFVPHVQLCSLICIILAAIELGCGSAVYSTLSPYFFQKGADDMYYYGYGSWWGAFFVLWAGLFGVLTSRFKGGLITTAVLSTAGFVTAIVGAVWDGNAALYFSTFQACLILPDNPSALVVDYYGNTDYYASLQKACLGRVDDDKLWLPSLTALSGGQLGHCVCVMADKRTCATLTLTNSALKAKYTCGIILDTYRNTLRSSAVFSALCAAAVAALAGMTCFIVCCGDRGMDRELELEREPSAGIALHNPQEDDTIQNQAHTY